MHDERDPESLLVEMISVHMENVAVGGVSDVHELSPDEQSAAYRE